MVVISSLVIAVLSIIFGILVIAIPKFLRFLVGGYFIIVGLIMLWPILM